MKFFLFLFIVSFVYGISSNDDTLSVPRFTNKHKEHPDGCTNFIITAGASSDGSTMTTYAADSHVLFGQIVHFPAGDHPHGTKRSIVEWDTGHYQGDIPEAAHTYNVIGNMNEWQLTIGETTYGGRPELQSQPQGIMDYGSMIYIALQRSKTAREAINVMTNLVENYGYISAGESFSIVDKEEAWLLEMIGKGSFELGAVWVARLIPDGYVCAHANQARIRTFPLNDPETCMYSNDVINFARKRGWFPKDTPSQEFSFSDTYNPVNFEGARACEVRVWSFFRQVASDMDKYLTYVQGNDLKNRMPLWVKPDKVKNGITVNDTMNYMRDHLEGTWFDFSKDIGAGPYHLPYRWRPLTYDIDGHTYINERSTATQQTGWSYVAQMRKWLPRQIGGKLWFGVDDTALSIYFPVYCGNTRVPWMWTKSPAKMMEFSFYSAFWVFNLVSNWVYTRYDTMYPEVFHKIIEYENKYLDETVSKIEPEACKLYTQSKPDAAIELLTAYTEEKGNMLVTEWLEYFQYLFMRFMDGNIKKPNPDPHEMNPIVDQPGYGQSWYKRIVDDTGDHYLEK